jgi:hypothetical protein
MKTGTVRLTIGGALALIAICGVGFAALSSPSPLWDNVIYTLTVALLVAAVLGAVFRREPAGRAFWGGFAIAGLAYLYLSRGYTLGTDDSQVGHRLATTALLDLLYSRIAPPTPPPMPPNTAGMMMSMRGMMAGGGMPGGAPGMMGMGGGTALAPDPSTTRWVQWTEPERSTNNFPINATATTDSPGAFLRIGHSLFALISGLLGGLLAWRWRRDGRPSEAPARAA